MDELSQILHVDLQKSRRPGQAQHFSGIPERWRMERSKELPTESAWILSHFTNKLPTNFSQADLGTFWIGWLEKQQSNPRFGFCWFDQISPESTVKGKPTEFISKAKSCYRCSSFAIPLPYLFGCMPKCPPVNSMNAFPVLSTLRPPLVTHIERPFGWPTFFHRPRCKDTLLL